MIETLVKEIRAYCADSGMPVERFCRSLLGDRRFVARLEAGGQCLPRTMARVRQYMAENPPQQRGRAA